MKRAKANSGEKASAAVTQPASAPILVQVHLWTEPGGADVPPPALAMVADLLQVRGGELRDAPADSIAASFPDAVLAVNAARNLQRLVEGFAHAWHGGDLRGCTTITRADEAQAGIDAGLLRDVPALKQTHPGQVIFTDSLCDAARSIPGLEFRAILSGLNLRRTVLQGKRSNSFHRSEWRDMSSSRSNRRSLRNRRQMLPPLPLPSQLSFLDLLPTSSYRRRPRANLWLCPLLPTSLPARCRPYPSVQPAPLPLSRVRRTRSEHSRVKRKLQGTSCRVGRPWEAPRPSCWREC